MFSSNSETENILTSIGKEKKPSKHSKVDNDDEILSDTDQEDNEEEKSDSNDEEGDPLLKLPSKRKHSLVSSVRNSFYIFRFVCK